MRNLSKRNATQHQQTCLRHANPYASSKRRLNANQPRDTHLMREQKRGSICGNTARQFRELRVGISDDRISSKLRIENRPITWHRWRLRQALPCVTRPAPLSRLDARKKAHSSPCGAQPSPALRGIRPQMNCAAPKRLYAIFTCKDGVIHGGFLGVPKFSRHILCAD